LPSAAPSAVPGELLVSFKAGVSPAEIGRFYAEHGVSERQALDRYAPATAAHLKLVAVPPTRTAELAASLGNDPRVAYAEPNYVYAKVATAATPTEPIYALQWNLDNTGQWSTTPDADIDAPEAWRVTTGSPDVLVAELDFGVDYTHPDLAANIWTNPLEVPGDGIDNDGNGYVDDIHGYDFVNNDADPMDDDAVNGGHGTAVAGVLGATPFNGGTVGVAWQVGIIPIKIIAANNTVKTSDVVRAFEYINYLKAVEHQNIVATNNSYGLDQTAAGPSRALRDAMAGLDQPGMSPILHVCAVGNANSNDDVAPVFPACYDLPNIISVAATDWNDRYADFSNFGAKSVDLAAPGVNIATTVPHGGYTFTYHGTSAAAPQVTGAAALVASAFPGLTAAQIKQRILDGVDPIGQIGDNALKPTVTNGRLNVANALAGRPTDNDREPPAAVANLAATGSTFQSVTLRWTASGDDGLVGRAASYDLRYSTAPITTNSWDAATRATGEPGPRPAGAAETGIVTGLDPSKSYYFALKVRDEMGNESGLSNVAVGTTGPAAVVFADDMEGGSNGWTASGLWHQSALRSNSPTTSWYYGDEATRTYDTGAATSGLLTSPVINLKNAVHPVLIYREWRQVEDGAADPFTDVARVQVGTGPNRWDTVSQSWFSTAVDPLNWQDRGALLGWTGHLRSDLSEPQWVSRSVDLSAYVGQKVQVRFAFAAGDALFNDYEGWYVDDLAVYDTALTVPAGGSATATGNGSSAAPALDRSPTGVAALSVAPGGAGWGSESGTALAPPESSHDSENLRSDWRREQNGRGRPAAIPAFGPGMKGAVPSSRVVRAHRRSSGSPASSSLQDLFLDPPDGADGPGLRPGGRRG
jgi:subtilisin family serine protease